MIKRILAVFTLSLFSISLSSQGKLEGGLYAGYFQLGYRGFNDFGGILHVPIGDNTTLNYHLGAGSSLNSGIYVHAPGGLVAGLWVLDRLGNGGNRVGYLALLCCLVPEGVGYYFPTKGKFQPHISINPLGVEYFYRSRTGEEWGKMSCDIVGRIKMKTSFKKSGLYFAPQIAATYIYTPGATTSRLGFKAGFTLGFQERD
jgi:hypothetical protein